jgi:hypothetical protein
VTNRKDQNGVARGERLPKRQKSCLYLSKKLTIDFKLKLMQMAICIYEKLSACPYSVPKSNLSQLRENK